MSSVQPQVSVILAAGGRGMRFGAGKQNDKPKQFLELRGYPIFVWSLRTLLSSPVVADAVIVAPPDLIAPLKQQLDAVSELLHGKSVKVVPGGATRQNSVYFGLLELEGRRTTHVLIHDAARPFLNMDLVDRCTKAAIEYGAFTAGIPVSDTIQRIEGNQIIETLDRDSLMLVQTPQGGRFDWLLEGHRRALDEEKATTDDAAILAMSGHKVSIVDGASFNIKITRPDDLILADALAAILFTDRL
jgi:2-C-methyl-D-erythritol 4-phosphate cytidylyltransferase